MPSGVGEWVSNYLEYGGVFMPAKVICVHGITPKSTCRLCRNEMARISNRKHYNPDRNKVNYQANKYAHLARMTNQYAKKFGAPGIVTAEMYQKLISRPCDYCKLEGLPMQIDHIIPLSKGGTNEISNLHGTCQYCNRSKGYYGEDEFLDWLNRVRAS